MIIPPQQAFKEILELAKKTEERTGINPLEVLAEWYERNGMKKGKVQ